MPRYSTGAANFPKDPLARFRGRGSSRSLRRPRGRVAAALRLRGTSARALSLGLGCGSAPAVLWRGRWGHRFGSGSRGRGDRHRRCDRRSGGGRGRSRRGSWSGGPWMDRGRSRGVRWTARRSTRMVGRGWRRMRSDRSELARLPGVGHPEDRRVLEEQVGVPARPTDARPEGKLAARTQRERAASEAPTGLQVVRPDEIGRAAVTAHGCQAQHLADAATRAPRKKCYGGRSARPTDSRGPSPSAG